MVGIGLPAWYHVNCVRPKSGDGDGKITREDYCTIEVAVNCSGALVYTLAAFLDASGAVQMGILKKIFLARDERWLLVPDQSVFMAGGRSTGKVLNLPASHGHGKWIMVHLADRANVLSIT